jgi:putative salt-induced outer membrane protein YdiY
MPARPAEALDSRRHLTPPRPQSIENIAMKPQLSSVSILFVALWVASMPAVAERQKLDIVVLFNGDRLTGEIKSLSYGRLTIETDYMGTVQIEWPDVVRVESPQSFLVEDTDGHLLYGNFPADPQTGQLSVAGDGAVTHRVAMPRVARLSQSEDRLLDRVHGSFSLGFDYTKSSDIAVLSGSFNTNYRGPKSSWSFGVDLNSTRDPAQGTIDRDSIKYSYRWLQPGNRFWAGLTSVERNEETGIEARVLVGGGYGRYFLQSASNEVAALVGIGATREWATGAADDQTSLEGILGVDWRIFDFASPTTSLSAKGLLYPSLTESGRYRTDASVSLRREIVSDFYIDLSFYQTYDSDPPDLEAATTDYGIVTSLGYSF